jgi:hypothetical protein
LSHFSSPLFCDGFFLTYRVWLGTRSLLIFASWVASCSMRHRCLVCKNFCKCHSVPPVQQLKKKKKKKNERKIYFGLGFQTIMVERVWWSRATHIMATHKQREKENSCSNRLHSSPFIPSESPAYVVVLPTFRVGLLLLVLSGNTLTGIPRSVLTNLLNASQSNQADKIKINHHAR